jgi:SSS family solute:Na+ symporter
MGFIDWSIVVILLVFMSWAAWHTKRYNRSVADFLAANRCAGRYMLGVSDGIANIGAISIIMLWEMYYLAGFSLAWWSLVVLVVQLVVALTGWVAYRYRQTRALTLAQFIEMRYSRRLRIFCGIVLFVSGTLNFGIFPAVGARFFQHFCGLPTDIIVNVGPLAIDVVYMNIIIILLAVSLYFTFAGGQITVMVTDFIQGTFFNIALCAVIVFVMFKMPWSDIIEALSNKPAGESMLHPFKAAQTKDYNLSFYLIGALVIFWTFMAWQGAQGYFAAAKNAHEARMGRVMGNWRILTQQMLVLLLPIAAYTFLHHANWTVDAAAATNALSQIGDETIRNQVTTSVALRYFLPIGLMGVLSAVLLAAFISTNDTYLHSWGSIFIQDIVLPLRKGKPLDTKTHMRWLKIAIFGVAVFIFFYSLLFSQNDTIAMYFALTGTIWLGGAGAVIVGGLYTRWGTTAGAYAAVIGGIVAAVTIFTCQRIYPDFPVNAMWGMLYAMLITALLYLAVSLLTCRKKFNLDSIHHHGEYAVAADQVKPAQDQQPVRGLGALFGMGKDFSFTDKIVYSSITGWSVLWGILFIGGCIYNYFINSDVDESTWGKFWHFYVWLSVVLGVITTIWFTIGGLVDLKDLFRRLGTMDRDESDDGTVEHK